MQVRMWSLGAKKRAAVLHNGWKIQQCIGMDAVHPPMRQTV